MRIAIYYSVVKSYKNLEVKNKVILNEIDTVE